MSGRIAIAAASDGSLIADMAVKFRETVANIAIQRAGKDPKMKVFRQEAAAFSWLENG